MNERGELGFFSPVVQYAFLLGMCMFVCVGAQVQAEKYKYQLTDLPSPPKSLFFTAKPSNKVNWSTPVYVSYLVSDDRQSMAGQNLLAKLLMTQICANMRLIKTLPHLE